MPLPGDLHMVTVTGTISHPDGSAAGGTVTFAMPYPLRDSTGHVVLGNTPPVVAQLVAGAFSVNLPATDQSQISPVNWAYTITIATDAVQSTFQAQLPSSPSSTTLDALIPLVTPPAVGLYVPLTYIGAANGVPSLDSTAHVPVAQLPTPAALGAVTAVWSPAAGRTTTNPNPGSGSNGLIQSACRVARTVHRVTTSGLTQVRLEYGNFYTQQQSPGEVAGPNSVSYRAAVEYPAGIWRQVSGSTTWDPGTTYFAYDQVVYSGVTYVALGTTTAGHIPSSYVGVEWQVVTRYLVTWTGQDGNRRIAVAGGGTVASIPVTLTSPLAVGSLIAVSTEATTAATTQYIPPGDVAFTSTPGWDFALDYTSPPAVGSATDPVDSGVTTQATLGNGTSIPMPLAITGTPTKTGSTLLLGDSILLGNNDSYQDSYQPGWAVRALGGAGSWWRSAKTGDQAAFFLSQDTIRLGVAARETAAIVDYGTNDIRSGNSLSTVQTNLVAVWTALAQRGLAVWQATITPQTTSTDSWATVGNQTAAAGFGPGSVWANLNAWLRSGAAWYIGGVQLTAGQPGHPLVGVLDVAVAVTDPGTGWAWVATWTTDGVHPTSAGHAAMATAASTVVDARSTTLLVPAAKTVVTAVVSKTTAYTAEVTDSVILCSAAGGAFTVTLPSAVGLAGHVYTIKKTDSSANAVTIATTSSQTIDGAATKTLSTQYSLWQVASDGANWQILGAH